MSGSAGRSVAPSGESSATRLRVERPAGDLPPGGASRSWLCLHFPRLPLEVLGEAARRAVVSAEGRDSIVLLCDEVASRHGVRPGISAGAALALVPDLDIRAREQRLEHRALHALAAWAVRFSPWVSPDPCGALLLEIAGSAALFGGPERLLEEAVAGVGQRGHAVSAAIAPTARAALWLACCGERAIIVDPARLPGTLATLPLALPGWPPEVRLRLRRMGVQRLGQCLRLPREGLARRIGSACLVEIDEALGKRPEVRRGYACPPVFREELELPTETRDSAMLRQALRQLLRRLLEFMGMHQGGTRSLLVRLRHGPALAATRLRIGMLRPGVDVAHMEELAAMHLERVEIPAPVTAVLLEAEVSSMITPATGNLLGPDTDGGERLVELVERLRTRLGEDSVHAIGTRPEHRPESAWQRRGDLLARRAVEALGIPGCRRPLWLLEVPKVLGLRSGLPFLHGPLTIEGGPERIETGWWDGRDVQRDYHVARSSSGARLWIFRDLRDGAWYLHGLFG